MNKGLPDRKHCLRLSSIFKILSHPQRLYIVCCLCRGEATVKDLEKACGAPQPRISQHLTRMRLEGLIASRRSGTRVHYRIADQRIPGLIRSMERICNG